LSQINTAPPSLRKTLGLTGITMNAMALIAPGAFLWLTFQLQAANFGGATDMWTGIVAALVIAFLTALSFSELARRYPEAGAGGSYYFAEKAFLDRDEPQQRRFARIAKFITGWAAHLFYWVYPSVMVAFMVVLLTYILSQFGVTVSFPIQIALAGGFAILVGFIAVRGITGSTRLSLVINIVQLISLIGFSVLAILFRLQNPLHVTQWVHPSAGSIVIPHGLSAMLFQSTLAMIILVGFESSTALAAESLNPKRDIPRGVVISLLIQGLFAYLLEYFAANYALSEKLVVTTANGSTLTGLAAAAASTAPIGDLTKQIGDAMLGQNGLALMLIIAITVALSILGTTLAAINTAVRISFAMSQDNEMPEVLGVLGRHATPHKAVWILAGVSAILGAVGVKDVTALTGLTLASNFGACLLYGLTCAMTFIAFFGRPEFNRIKHGLIPALGLLGNVGLLIAIVVIGLGTPGTSQEATKLALRIMIAWGIVSGAYLIWNSGERGKPILPKGNQIAS
jgi:amino acid transporter